MTSNHFDTSPRSRPMVKIPAKSQLVNMDDHHHDYHSSTGIMTPESFTMSPGTMQPSDVCANPQVLFNQQSSGWAEGFHHCHDRHSISAPSYRHFNPLVKQEDSIRHHSLRGSHHVWNHDTYPYSSTHPESPNLTYHDDYANVRGSHFTGQDQFMEDQSGEVSSCSSSSDRNWVTTTREPDEESVRQSIRLSQAGSDVLRSDGVRKKNAKFEIPQERTIDNIDYLLKREKDDDKRKELKMQKRLLKNREAALQSRQRKKKHTENLEEEKKGLTTAIHRLEDEVRRLRAEVESHQQEKTELTRLCEESDARLHGMEVEKDQLVKAHKQETTELHNQIQMLQESMVTAQSSPITAPSSDGFVDFANDMEKVNLNGNQWEGFELINDMCFEPEQPLTIRPTSSSPLIHANNLRPLLGVDETFSEARVSTMLLLYGAYIASNFPATASSIVPPILPEDVRAASRRVVDKFLDSSNPVFSHQHISHDSQSRYIHQQFPNNPGPEIGIIKTEYRAISPCSPTKSFPNLQVNIRHQQTVAEFRKVLEQT